MVPKVFVPYAQTLATGLGEVDSLTPPRPCVDCSVLHASLFACFYFVVGFPRFMFGVQCTTE